MVTRQGQLLIAGADMDDPNFARTVSVLVEHGDQGALGLVLNRPTEISVAQAWRQVSQTSCTYDGRLHQGGPCQGPLMILHTDADRSQIEVVPGLYFTADAEDVASLLERPDGQLRCFAGYAGWAAQQLEHELDRASWIVRAATVGDVFDAPPGERHWLSLLSRINPAQAAYLVNPDILPEDPSNN
jgi:putative transcriptional regulator